MSEDRRDQILDFAEREIRKGGLDAVSFRDIASAIGVKSSSVHYYFPTKSDLTLAVTQRYSERFLKGLGEPNWPVNGPSDRLMRLANAYLDAYKLDSATCLCAVLGSIPTHLPKSTAEQIHEFFRKITDWTTKALEGSESQISPSLVVSLLQGAMILAMAIDDETPLLDAREYLARMFE